MGDSPCEIGVAPFLTVEAEETDDAANLSPIYTAMEKRTVRKSGNLTCSGCPEDFCFLCCYTSTSDCEVDLRAHILSLSEQGQEVTVIANAIHSIYESSIRKTLIHEKSNGTMIEAPEWSPESIRRHLLLSPEFAEVFKNYEHYLFKSLIVRQAETIVNPQGRVNPEMAKTLLATIKQYSEYRCKTLEPATKRRRGGQNEIPT